ncbi:hypothetical protein L9F63_008881, partial [Diploptera punctata]
ICITAVMPAILTSGILVCVNESVDLPLTVIKSLYDSDLLETITTTADIEDCPGLCVHTIATLMCYEILENVKCPSPSMRCCVDLPSNNTVSSTSSTQTSVSTSTRRPQSPDPPSKPQNPTTAVEKHDTVKTCPGVCVTENVADYCEAILDISNLCKTGLSCCVSRNDDLPSDVIHLVQNATRPSDTSSSSSTPSKPTTPAPRPQTTTQRPPASPPLPLRPKCEGECVNGLFALFCDDIDSLAHCADDNTCCITRNQNQSGRHKRKTFIKRPYEMEQASTSEISPPGTRTRVARTRSDDVAKHFTTRIQRPTTTTTSAPLPRCPGFCLLTIMAAFCERPSVLISHTSNCQRGSVCCDNTRSHHVTTSRPRPRPTSRPATTSSTTTTPPSPPDNRPECPGSCIVSYLSFTCFRNAEMTELFRCRKSGTQCCAPKSSIRELQEQKNGGGAQARNETVAPHYRPMPPQQHIAVSASHLASSTTVRPPVYSKYVCGVKGAARAGRVVGGEDGDPAEWCWQVALINSLNQYLCGGALIGTQWVLTAAHCVTNIVRSGDAIYVRVGDHDLTRKYGSPGAQTLRVATTYIHHNHNSQTLDNDIALLKLHGQAELKDGVCLVCLPARGVSQAAGKRCTVTGYGYMGE